MVSARRLPNTHSRALQDQEELLAELMRGQPAGDGGGGGIGRTRALEIAVGTIGGALVVAIVAAVSVFYVCLYKPRNRVSGGVDSSGRNGAFRLVRPLHRLRMHASPASPCAMHVSAGAVLAYRPCSPKS